MQKRYELARIADRVSKRSASPCLKAPAARIRSMCHWPAHVGSNSRAREAADECLKRAFAQLDVEVDQFTVPVDSYGYGVTRAGI